MTPLRRLLAALVVTALTVGALALGPGAGAQSVQDKRAEAERVASELEQLRIQASQLDEQHHQALLELETVQQDILDAEVRVADLRDQTDARRTEVQQYALVAYIGGGDPDAAALLEDAEPNQVGTKAAYLRVASGNRQDLIDELSQAQGALDAELADLDAAQADAQRLEEEARSALAGAQQAVADEEAIYARVQGELADLVAAEEARRAAEARRRAEEQARQAAAAAAQAPPPAAPTADEIDEINDDPPETPPTSGVTTTVDVESSSTTTTTPSTDGGGGGVGAPPAGAAGAVSLAYSLIGTPYVWGGSSPSSGFDCSGFTGYVWGQNGYPLPHSAAAQAGMVTQLPLSELQPGDLVFYGWGYIHHVALYVGGGQIVHAPGKGKAVRVDSIYYWDQLHYAGRLPS